MTGRLWLLNLDAEDELAQGFRPTPSRAERERMRAMTRALRGTLVPFEDRILGIDDPIPAGLEGRAWCPTAWALSALKSLGANAIETPTMHALRRANHRGWAAEALGTPLPRSRWCADADALGRHLDGPWPRDGWILKRAFTFAGRGRLWIRGRDELDGAAARGWIARSFSHDGVLAEPCVKRLADLGLHGYLTRDGALSTGDPTVARVDARGQWAGSSLFDGEGVSREELSAVHSEFERVASALRSIGYHGPFGVDAFVWEDAAGRRMVQPRSDLNARYSMGWAVGMGRRRPDLTSP